MSEARDQGETLELLGATLDTYGADASRWPPRVQARLTAFAASNGAAKRLVAEAQALDKVLGFAPKLSDARQADLVERIVARASHQPRMVADRAAPAVRPRFGSARANAASVAALAASLVLGIFAGQNTTVGSLANAMIEGTVTNSAAAQQVAQSDGADSLLDEDLL
ncbi:MAG: hypothetical protein ABL893_01085 [Hyphomicrobium sp.]